MKVGERYSWMGYPLTRWHRGPRLAVMMAVMVNGLADYIAQTYDLPAPLKRNSSGCTVAAMLMLQSVFELICMA